MRGILAVVALATLSLSTNLAAQPYIAQYCGPPTVMTHPRFDDETHALWYKRFWTGDCSSLSFCSSGTPYWNAAIAQMLPKAPAAQRASVRVKACRVGRLVGFEWAKDNGVRKIDTGDLSQFINDLEQSNNVSATLDQIEAQARRALGH